MMVVRREQIRSHKIQVLVLVSPLTKKWRVKEGIRNHKQQKEEGKYVTKNNREGKIHQFAKKNKMKKHICGKPRNAPKKTKEKRQ